MNDSKKARLACASLQVLAMALCFGGSAYAQAADGASDSNEISELIVTAQRREESIVDVPISMSVMNAEVMQQAGVTEMRDLRLVVPGLNMDSQAVYIQPTIRGVSAKDSSPGNEPAVAVYIDGIYQPAASGLNMEFPDVERIEVARGPQGTLFGRNATGGAISIFTKRPNVEDVSGNLTMGYGSYTNLTASGFVNVPIVPGLAALSISGAHEHRDGYFHSLISNNDFGELTSSMIRAKLLLEPTDYLSVLFTALYQRRDDESLLAFTVLNGNTVGRNTPGAIIPTRPYDLAHSPVTQGFDLTQRQYSMQVDLDLGFASLRSISAYDQQILKTGLDATLSSANPVRYDSYAPIESWQQEVTLTSNGGGPLDWVLGGFYFTSEARSGPLLVRAAANQAILTAIRGEQDTEAYAVFGELNWQATDRLSVILGARYSHEERSLSGHFNGADNYGPLIAERSFHATTPRVSVRYELGPSTNVYGTISQGFKSGGFTTTSLQPIPFAPEKITSYEVGLKRATSDYRLNVAAFYSDYKDLQERTLVTVPGVAIPVATVFNAAGAEIYGLELDGQWFVNDDWTVIAAVSVLDAKYTEFPNAIVALPRPFATCTPPGNGPCGNLELSVDASGNPLIRSPDFTVSLGVNYEHEYRAGTFSASANVFYTDDFTFTPDTRLRQEAYATVNANLSFQPTGSPVTIRVWGKNLTDEEVIAGTHVTRDVDGVTYVAPRMVGAELHYEF